MPKPVQQPHPPLRIAANSPETAVFAGQQGYPVFVASPINRNNKLPEHIGRYQTAFDEAGHDPNKQDVAIAFPVFVADSLEQVRHHVEPSFLNYFRAIGIQARLGRATTRPNMTTCAPSSTGRIHDLGAHRGQHGAVRTGGAVYRQDSRHCRQLSHGPAHLLV